MIHREEYKKCLEEIFHRFPSVQQTGFGNAYKPGLDHMERFADLLGHPERDFRTIHVAGTNGKGSVSSMLASMLSAAGLRTGLYTSPHLLDFRERMRVLPGANPAPRMVPKEYVLSFIQKWRKDFEQMDLSFFEITTGMAFRWFADEKVDVAVIEVGLGGRLDSTNIIRPDLSVITSIGLDHCQLLGHTRAAVAGEKAGIITGYPRPLWRGRCGNRPGLRSQSGRGTGSAGLCSPGGTCSVEPAVGIAGGNGPSRRLSVR